MSVWHIDGQFISFIGGNGSFSQFLYLILPCCCCQPSHSSGVSVLVSDLLLHLGICECLQEGWPLVRLRLVSDRYCHLIFVCYYKFSLIDLVAPCLVKKWLNEWLYLVSESHLHGGKVVVGECIRLLVPGDLKGQTFFAEWEKSFFRKDSQERHIDILQAESLPADLLVLWYCRRWLLRTLRRGWGQRTTSWRILPADSSRPTDPTRTGPQGRCCPRGCSA